MSDQVTLRLFSSDAAAFFKRRYGFFQNMQRLFWLFGAFRDCFRLDFLFVCLYVTGNQCVSLSLICLCRWLWWRISQGKWGKIQIFLYTALRSALQGRSGVLNLTKNLQKLAKTFCFIYNFTVRENVFARFWLKYGHPRVLMTRVKGRYDAGMFVFLQNDADICA